MYVGTTGLFYHTILRYSMRFYRLPLRGAHAIPSCAWGTRAGWPSVWTFMALERVRPRALRQAMPIVHMMRAAQGWEKTNIAVTLSAGKCRRPEKTSRPTASLLPTCPGGVGRM